MAVRNRARSVDAPRGSVGFGSSASTVEPPRRSSFSSMPETSTDRASHGATKQALELQESVSMALSVSHNTASDNARQFNFVYVSPQAESWIQRCLPILKVTDPVHDKGKIKLKNPGLCEAYCVTICTEPIYLTWKGDEEKDQDTLILWIYGDENTTEMMVALTDALSESSILSYCLFNRTLRDTSNMAVSVLRVLIFQLITKRRELVKHLEQDWKLKGEGFFMDQNALHCLWGHLLKMLADLRPGRVYLLIDGIHKWDFESHLLLTLIARNCRKLDHVRWCITSRDPDEWIARLLTPTGCSKKYNIENRGGDGNRPRRGETRRRAHNRGNRRGTNRRRDNRAPNPLHQETPPSQPSLIDNTRPVLVQEHVSTATEPTVGAFGIEQPSLIDNARPGQAEEDNSRRTKPTPEIRKSKQPSSVNSKKPALAEGNKYVRMKPAPAMRKIEQPGSINNIGPVRVEEDNPTTTQSTLEEHKREQPSFVDKIKSVPADRNRPMTTTTKQGSKVSQAEEAKEPKEANGTKETEKGYSCIIV